MNEYPKAMYHQTELPSPRLVRSSEEEAALGDGWQNSPVFDAPAPAVAPDAPARKKRSFES